MPKPKESQLANDREQHPTSAPQISAKEVPFSERLLLDTQAAAEMLSLSPRTFEKLPIPRVKIPGVRRTLYRRIDLDVYVRSLTS